MYSHKVPKFVLASLAFVLLFLVSGLLISRPAEKNAAIQDSPVSSSVTGTNPVTDLFPSDEPDSSTGSIDSPSEPSSQAKPPRPPEDSSSPALNTEVVYYDSEVTLKAYLCKPEGDGTFPLVQFNHGGKEGLIGGAPEETCQALAKAGYVGFSPIRREEFSLNNNLQDVLRGLDYALELEYVDTSRVALMGFSRGGLLTFMAATELQNLDAVVIMASAPPSPTSEKPLYAKAKNISGPVLFLVAENDTPPYNTENQDHVAISEEMYESVLNTGQAAKRIVYSSYESNGHELFFSVGDYWKDILEFLEETF